MSDEVTTFSAWACPGGCGLVVTDDALALFGAHPWPIQLSFLERLPENGGGFYDVRCYGPDGEGHGDGRPSYEMNHVVCAPVDEIKEGRTGR